MIKNEQKGRIFVKNVNKIEKFLKNSLEEFSKTMRGLWSI